MIKDNVIEKRRRNDKVILTVNRVFCYVILGLLTLLCLFPFYLLIINATRSNIQITSQFSLLPGNFFLKNLQNLLNTDEMPVVRALINSLLISSICAVLTTYFSAMTAFGIHMYDFKLKKFAFSFIMIVMMVPTQVSALGFIKLVTKMGMMNTFYPLILPSIAAPVVFFFMKQYMESVLPFEVVEAARVDGSNEFRTFNTIVLPMIKPALAVQAIFTFVSTWNNFFIPALIIDAKEKRTIPILMAILRSADYSKFDMGKVYMLICIAIIPVLIMYLFLSKFIIRGITLGSVKG